MNYHPSLHHRRSIRLKGHNYSGDGRYFITLCCQHKIPLFGQIINGSVILNQFGQIIRDELEKTPMIRPHTILHEFIIMPDHFHAIIEILPRAGESHSPEESHSLDSKQHFKSAFQSPSQTVGAIIRGFKGATTRRIRETLLLEQKNASNRPVIHPKSKIWQRNYYEHIIRNETAYLRISQYIRNNPIKWTQANSIRPKPICTE